MADSGHRSAQCIAPGCERRREVAGYCAKHYQQVRRHGRLTPEREYLCGSLTQECKVSGCTNTWVAKGYCHRHYQQIRRHGRLTPERQKPRT